MFDYPAGDHAALPDPEGNTTLSSLGMALPEEKDQRKDVNEPSPRIMGHLKIYIYIFYIILNL